MGKITFTKAHYITLGKDFCYADECIRAGILKVDWKKQKIEDIRNKKWNLLKQQIVKEMNFSHAATHDFNSLRAIAEATPDEIWITRQGDDVWWGKMESTPLKQDESKSKYRIIQDGWSNTDINGTKLKIDKTGKEWLINGAFPTVARTMKYSATECSIKDRNALDALLNGTH